MIVAHDIQASPESVAHHPPDRRKQAHAKAEQSTGQSRQKRLAIDLRHAQLAEEDGVKRERERKPKSRNHLREPEHDQVPLPRKRPLLGSSA
jgi:hypothetical protein